MGTAWDHRSSLRQRINTTFLQSLIDYLIHKDMSSSRPRNLSYRDIDPKRRHLQEITQQTIKAINDGHFYLPDLTSNMPLRQDITIDTELITEYFRPESHRLKSWQRGPPPAVAAERHVDQLKVAVQIERMSTLQGAYSLSQKYPASRVGVLNFASATRPGGGFVNGASAQEESIARSSTLYVSLTTPQARPFYDLHDRDNKGGYYSHAMIYSPAVTIFRDDDGNWLQPYHVDIVTSPAVNAGLVRRLYQRRYGRKSETEARILSVMKERMGRILALFEGEGTRNLVLGSFGTGVFQNEVVPLARIWGELLDAPGARFAYSFDQVIFAIPDVFTWRQFRRGFSAGASPPSNRFRL